MRITAVKVANGWNVFPQSGPLQGKLIARADGLSLLDARFDGDSISGDVAGVWGMEVLDPMFYSDPRTVRGMRIGFTFNMRDQTPVVHDGEGYVTKAYGERIGSAKTLWVLGDEMQAYGERIAIH